MADREERFKPRLNTSCSASFGNCYIIKGQLTQNLGFFFAGPSEPPKITSLTVLNSTSVLLKWEPVPRASQNGIIRRYTIHFRDVEKNDSVTVKAPAVNATVNGLRQKAEYLFWIVAATSVGDGPSSVSKTATTKGKGHYTATLRSRG